MTEMLLQGRTVDQNVIKEYKNTFSQQRSKGGIHGPLESSRCSTEAKGNNLKFKMTKVSLEGSFILITFVSFGFDGSQSLNLGWKTTGP